MEDAPAVTELDDLGGAGTGQGLTEISNNLIASFSNAPGFVAIFAYIVGLFLILKSLFDFVKHVNQDDNTTLRSPVISMLVGGALVALPYLYEVFIDSVDGGGGWTLAGLNMYTDGGDTSIIFNAFGETLGFTNPGAACPGAAAPTRAPGTAAYPSGTLSLSVRRSWDITLPIPP